MDEEYPYKTDWLAHTVADTTIPSIGSHGLWRERLQNLLEKGCAGQAAIVFEVRDSQSREKPGICLVMSTCSLQDFWRKQSFSACFSTLPLLSKFVAQEVSYSMAF
ncbi:unnamed protein product [Dovyalis caffra]|uniref:Uncharacterized protein n=1 Tax=Dovyalis caffra TaxID=77055 RepID=A0AAV1RS54_9ROSI|nr:unnamed protein product [Dovyalis caffra]